MKRSKGIFVAIVISVIILIILCAFVVPPIAEVFTISLERYGITQDGPISTSVYMLLCGGLGLIFGTCIVMIFKVGK